MGNEDIKIVNVRQSDVARKNRKYPNRVELTTNIRIDSEDLITQTTIDEGHFQKSENVK